MKASTTEWKRFSLLIRKEADASRKLQLLLTDNRSATRVKHSNIYKPMNFIKVRKKT